MFFAPNAPPRKIRFFCVLPDRLLFGKYPTGVWGYEPASFCIEGQKFDQFNATIPVFNADASVTHAR